jgi:hypothetical protein
VQRRDQTELLRLRLILIQTLCAAGLIALVVIGGFVLMVKGVNGGQAIVATATGLIAGWIGGAKSRFKS